MKNVFLLLVTLVFAVTLNAQKVKLVEGKLGFLKDQSELKVEFTYNNMKIGKTTSQDYVNDKVSDKNKDEAGAGDEWLLKWQNDLDTTFPSHFIKHFNVMISKDNVKLSRDNDEANYILVVNTNFIEPGYNVGISSKRASANMEVNIVSKDNPDEVLATFSISKSPGTSMFGSSYSASDRIAGCYENAATRLAGYFMSKKTFK